MVTWSCSRPTDAGARPAGSVRTRCSDRAFPEQQTPIAVNPADAVLSRSGVCTLYIAAEGHVFKNCGSTSSDSVLQTNALGASFPGATNLSIFADGGVASWLQEVDTGDASPTATRQLFVRHATGTPKVVSTGPDGEPVEHGIVGGGIAGRVSRSYRQPGRLTRLNGSDGAERGCEIARRRTGADPRWRIALSSRPDDTPC